MNPLTWIIAALERQLAAAEAQIRHLQALLDANRQVAQNTRQYLLARYVGRRVRAADQAARDGQPATSADLSVEQRQQLGRMVEQLLERVRGPQGKQKAERAQELLAKAQELRKRSIAVHDKAHGSAVERERERLLATGLYGSRR